MSPIWYWHGRFAAKGELAVRVALGASKGALRRMLLAESLLLLRRWRSNRRIERAADGGRPGALRLALLHSRSRFQESISSLLLGAGAALAIVAAVVLAFVPRLAPPPVPLPARPEDLSLSVAEVCGLLGARAAASGSSKP